MLDMNQIVPSNFCLVDGVWGNEFDEVQSTPKRAGVIVGGENAVAVDIVAAAAMGIDARKIETYRLAEQLWGPVDIQIAGSGADSATAFRQGCLFSTRLRYIKETCASLCYRMVNRH